MHFHRSTFLIDQKFQLRFSFFVCSWLLILCLGYPFIISNLFDHFIHYLAFDPKGPVLVKLEQTRKELIWLLVIMQLILLNFTFLISIFMSHRIAGPLFKLRNFFQEAKAGNLSEKLYLRKSDYFQDLATDYNDMIDSIRGRIEQQVNGINTAIPIIERVFTHVPPEIRTELELALTALRETQKI